MGAYYDLPAATAVLKELYDGQIVENEVYKENPAFAMIPKKTNFYGKSRPLPLAYGVQSATSNFTNAQANQAPIQYSEFLITRKRLYAIATIDNETMEATENDKGAFVDAITENVDKAIQAATLLIASSMFRAGTGSIGQVSTATAISSGVITLQDPSVISQFEVNQVLQANATDGGASPRAALGYVISVDRFAGTVTVSATGFNGSAGTPSGWTTSDFLLVQGNLNSTMSGFPAWLLSTAPAGSDNFYGVNRSADRWRLAGGYYNGAAQSIEEALIDAANLLGREGSSPNMCFMSFTSYSALEKSLGAKVQYTNLGTNFPDTGTIAFDGIKINGPKGVITVIPDRNCPAQVAYLLKMSNWTLRSLGEFPKILTYKDNNQMLRVNNADAMELRVGGYGNLDCAAPGWSAQVALSA